MSARRLPHSTEIEKALLGGLLTDPSQLADVADSLTVEDWFRPQHAELFRLLIDLTHAGGYDLAVVLDEVVKREPATFGGVAYVVALPNACPSVESISLYAAKLRDLSARRRLLLAAYATIDAAEDASRPTDELIAEATDRLAVVAHGTKTGAAWEHIAPITSRLNAELEARTRAHAEARASGRTAITGIPTGFRDLDRITQGLHATDLVILAGRSAMGKTAFAMELALGAARSRRPVGVFSLEMGAKQLVQRMLASESRVDASRLRSGDLDESDHWPRLCDGMERISGLPIYFDENAGIGLAQVRARTLRLKAERPDLGLIVIDYLGLMRAEGFSREQAIGAITRGLKQLAKEAEVCILCLSQLNRNLEGRTDKRPMMSDLRESGSVEQDADTILFVYRDEVYNPDTADRGVAEIIIGKQRSGATGTVKLAYQAVFTRFANLIDEPDDARNYQ